MSPSLWKAAAAEHRVLSPLGIFLSTLLAGSLSEQELDVILVFVSLQVRRSFLWLLPGFSLLSLVFRNLKTARLGVVFWHPSCPVFSSLPAPGV